MADPKLEIEKRFDEKLNRIELAVGTMAQWLVQAQTGFSAKDAEGIEKILRGEKMESSIHDAERIAKAFHDSYETIAPEFNYKTRPESAVPWDDVPENNQALMIAVVKDLLVRGVIRASP